MQDKNTLANSEESLLNEICRENGMNAGKAWKRLRDVIFPYAKEARIGVRLGMIASLLIVIGIQLFTPTERPLREIAAVKPVRNPAHVLPSPKTSALLVLRDGRTIQLDTVYYGTKYDGATIKSLVTPKAGQYSIALLDGTNIRLNNQSKVQFDGSGRSVKLEGEAYFKVAADAKHPFFVHTASMVAEVLGTEFNVSAYPTDSMTKTTLLAGKLIVRTNTQKKYLQPGELCVSTQEGLVYKEAGKASTHSDTSWLNGAYYFDSASLRSVLDQVSRWYDYKIRYETDSLPQRDYMGKIDKTVSLKDILANLEGDNRSIHFRIIQDTIVVSR